MEDASTMAQVDLQTCDVGVQALEMIEDVQKPDDNVHRIAEDARTNDGHVYMIDECVRKNDEYTPENGEDGRKIYKDLQETDKVRNRGEVIKSRMDESFRRRKRVPEPEERTNDKRDVKNAQPEKNKGRQNKRNEKKTNKGEDAANEVIAKKKDEENPKVSRKRKPLKMESGMDSINAMVEDNDKDVRKRAKAGSAWLLSSTSREEDIPPLEYSKTPGRLRKKSDESSQSWEKRTDKEVVAYSGEEIAGLATETSASEKSSKCSFGKLSQLTVCIEDVGPKRGLKVNENGAEVEEVSHKENTDDDKELTEESSRPALEKDEECSLGLTYRQKPLEGKPTGPRRKNAFEIEENQDSNKVQNKNKKARKVKEKGGNKKRKETKKVKSAKEKDCEDKIPHEEKGEYEKTRDKGGRALRKRTAQKRNCDVGLDLSIKGRVEDIKTLGTETRQEPDDKGTIATKKNDKIDERCLKGHEPVMSHMSSPQAKKLTREPELSSHEIDPPVDENPVTSCDTSQQPETEIQGGLNEENNKVAEGELLMDYNSAQGGSDKRDNRIKEAGKKTKRDYFHKELGKKKSRKSPIDGKNEINAAEKEKENQNIDLCLTKCEDARQTGKNSEHDNANVSKEKDTDVVNKDSSESSTREIVQSAIFPDTFQSKRKGSKHPCGKTKTFLKEKALNGEARGKKRYERRSFYAGIQCLNLGKIRVEKSFNVFFFCVDCHN